MIRTGEDSIFYGRWAVALTAYLFFAGVGAAVAISLFGYWQASAGDTTPADHTLRIVAKVAACVAIGFGILAFCVCLPALSLMKTRYWDDDPRTSHGTAVALAAGCSVLLIVAGFCTNHYLQQVRRSHAIPVDAPNMIGD